jgi:DNA repair exonuclease SbcCD ATPase subunit
MIFSIGDLITLVVVLLILVIYRALDRNNRSLEKLKRFSDKISENLSAFVDGKTSEVKNLSLELQASLKTGKEILARARGVEEILQNRSGDIDAIQNRLSEYDKALAELTAMSARVDKNLLRIRDESEVVEGIGRRIGESAERLQAIEQRIPDVEKGFARHAQESLAAAALEVSAHAEQKVAALSATLVESEKHVKDYSTYLSRLEAREEQVEKERLAGLAKSLDAFDADLRGRLSAAAQRGETLEDEVFTRLSSRIQADESSLARSMETIEQRISDYQGDVDYRVKALEEGNADVDALRASLSETMEKMAAGVRTEMKGIGAELVAGWTAEIASAASAREQIHAGMAELETGLGALKTKAYQDVESKLSVFEDEFFADLRARSNAMQEKFQTWQAEMEKRALAFEADVKERMSTADESVQTLRETLRVDIDKVKKDASVSFEKDLAVVRDSMEASARRMSREIESGMKELAGSLEAGRKELAELFEGSRAEINVWEEKTRQQLAEAELAIADKISTLSTEAGASIGSIRDSFVSQKEDLLVSTNEERMGLRKELSGMAEAISTHREELKRTTDTAMEALRGQLDAFQLETQKRMRDMQTDVETRIKDQKQQLADSRDKSEAMQEKLFGKVEESYRMLSANVAEIDKRVKNFQSQTRLFERADSLKAALEGTIDEMKKEMAKLNAERAEIAEIELQLTKTRKVADDVSTKLTRFLTDKRRIDEMDGDFKKIIALSRDVDLKLDTLSASNDALQQIQAKIRQFEDMGKTVDGGFERLEKKKEILSITSEGVDRNFQRLEGIEKSLQDADRSADDLAGKVQSLRSDYELLASNKKDAESAMEIVGKLTGIMEELEGRLEKAQSSREWMARTETRFEEIGRQAQEQVRLLESIMKSETKKDKGERGAPPLDKRETVVKLSHQGWSVQEISRVTQLSRGEVELILELAPKV